MRRGGGSLPLGCSTQAAPLSTLVLHSELFNSAAQAPSHFLAGLAVLYLTYPWPCSTQCSSMAVTSATCSGCLLIFSCPHSSWPCAWWVVVALLDTKRDFSDLRPIRERKTPSQDWTDGWSQGSFTRLRWFFSHYSCLSFQFVLLVLSVTQNRSLL